MKKLVVVLVVLVLVGGVVHSTSADESLVNKLITLFEGLTSYQIDDAVIEAKKRLGDEPAAYPISVDYERSVEAGVEAGHYEYVSPNIKSYNFPTKRTGTTEVVVELIHFKFGLSSNQVLRELDKMGYRPVDLHELLAFGEKYPKVQRKFPIAALGSIYRYGFCANYAPYLGVNSLGSRRVLNLIWVWVDWSTSYRVAAVPK